MTVSVQSQPWERPDKPIFSNAPPPQCVDAVQYLLPACNLR